MSFKGGDRWFFVLKVAIADDKEGHWNLCRAGIKTRQWSLYDTSHGSYSLGIIVISPRLFWCSSQEPGPYQGASAEPVCHSLSGSVTQCPEMGTDLVLRTLGKGVRKQP